MTPGDIVIGWFNGLSDGQLAATIALLLATTAVGVAIAEIVLGGPRKPPTGGATV